MDFYQTDSATILLQIRRQEKQLKSKRRWLLGLPTSVSGQMHTDQPDFLNNKNLPEFWLREDDVFYETVRKRVEKAFGVLDVERRHCIIQADQKLDARKIRKLILSCLDDLSTKGLYLLVKVLMEDSTKLGKTRWKLMKVVKEFLPKVLRSKGHTLIVKKLYELLSDPQNFRNRCLRSLTSSLPSYHDAVSQVLYRLGDLPTQSLLAMRRKFEGVRVMPQIKRHRHGWARDRLINILRETSEKMLALLGEGDELQESLAKAMAVADLSLKLVPGCHNFASVEFYPFSPQMKALHNEIVKAIWLISKKGNFQKLKELQSLLDPDAKVSNRCLRTAIKKTLIDYLFECCDMETVPKCLLKALATINTGSRNESHSFFSHEEIEKEIEWVFCLSAQMKQIAWDLLPNWDFDSEFADAYMEELEDSSDDNDDDDDDDDGCDGFHQEHVSRATDLHFHVEGTGESMSFNVETSLDSPFNHCPPLLESEFEKDMCNVSSDEKVDNMDTMITSNNQYLVIQEACDETSMIAYNFVGRLLEEFAKSEHINLDWGDHLYLSSVSSIEEDFPDDGQTCFKENVNDSIIIQVCQELISSLPKSGMKGLKQMLGL